MNEVFISYKRSARDSVYPIVRRIEKALGLKCWMDLTGIDYATQFDSVICNAIEECKVFILMYSKEHLEFIAENKKRKKSGLKEETDYTVKECKYAKRKKKVIILVNVDKVELDGYFLLHFADTQNCEDINDSLAFNKLVDDIKVAINREGEHLQTSSHPINRPFPTETASFPHNQVPVFVPFGYSSVGKSMLIKSLAQYLGKMGLAVRPVENFLKFQSDIQKKEYLEIANRYLNDDNKSLLQTEKDEIILFEVIQNGKTLCYILDVLGTHYYDNNSEDDLTWELVTLFSRYDSNNRRKIIWGFMLESNHSEAHNYVNRIESMRAYFAEGDKFLFIYNKCDKNPCSASLDFFIQRELVRRSQMMYPKIFERFRNPVPIVNWFRPFLFKILPYSSGIFKKNGTDYIFNSAKMEYQKKLWKAIRK